MIARSRVLDSRPETPSIHSIRIEKPERFDFAPVQFCGLELGTEEGPVEYSMSLACSPTQAHLEFGARVSGSAWKRAFQALKPGDEVEIDGPYGHFVLDESRDAVLVAGGIGITPLKGMLTYATDRSLPLHVSLLYSSRSVAEIAYRDEIDALARRNARARVLHTLTRPGADEPWQGRTGRVDAALLRESAQGLRDPAYYLCGTPAMVQDLALLLRRELDVPGERIRAEQFWGYE